MQTTVLTSTTNTPKYPELTIKIKAEKTKSRSPNLNQFLPQQIIPVMRSVPDPDSINNAMVSLALSEPLREKIINQRKIRRPKDPTESAEYLDTFEKRKHFGNIRNVKRNFHGNSTRKMKPHEDTSRETLGMQLDNYDQWIESSEEVMSHGRSQAKHDEKKRYSTRVSAGGQGEVEGPVYRGAGTTMSTVPEEQTSVYLTDQNGNTHQIPDMMVSQSIHSHYYIEKKLLSLTEKR